MYAGTWFGDGWFGAWFGDEPAAVPAGGYFGHRYFGARYFGPRYYSPYYEISVGSPTGEQGGYFGHTYFGVHFFPYRYFSPYYDVGVGSPDGSPTGSPDGSPIGSPDGSPVGSPDDEPSITVSHNVVGPPGAPRRFILKPNRAILLDDEEILVFLMAVLNSDTLH